MAPVHDALSVPEVVVSIVLEVPLLQIILIRRVCREFDRIITSSSAIQRALFLLPSGCHTLMRHESEHKTPGEGSGVTWKNGSGQATRPIRNPFIPAEYVRVTQPCTEFDYDFGGGRGASARGTVQESEGSFKDMLATQPSVVLPPSSILPMSGYNRDVQDHQTSDGSKALTYGSLVERAFCTFGHRLNRFTLHGGEKWAVLKKTVDEITGCEMLQILGDGYAGSDKSLFFESGILSK
ncbi:hypothetical protein LTR37_015401 [Vermiconidia calcicola]|uniref:Uncharacterized protein n=1 Tax=Vermiconidia calcicola TaxID=1690605 RepID=A0ACC3MSC9_9PEZI|nr:hypothetical protein LTR37_015401 [Vermiconidia calcicola]